MDPFLKGLKIDVEALKNIEPGEPEDYFYMLKCT